jgi:hypothetical protein
MSNRLMRVVRKKSLRVQRGSAKEGNQLPDRPSLNSETTNSSRSGYRRISSSMVDLISLHHQKPCQSPCSWRYVHSIFPLSSIRTRATRLLCRYTSYILIDLCRAPHHKILIYTIMFLRFFIATFFAGMSDQRWQSLAGTVRPQAHASVVVGFK